jgi:hypothetical protein
MRLDALLARLAIAVPVLYFGVLLVGAATWPGYSHVTQYASELGGPGAPRPAIFNVGIVVMGIVCVLSSLGVFLAARRLGGQAVLSALGALCVALFGVAMVMGGLHPMPDPLHGAYGLGLAMIPAPLLIALALRGRQGLGGLNAYLVASFAFVLATMVVMMGVGHLVTRANVGLWQRGNALAMFPWLGVTGWVLAGRLERRQAG